MVLTRTVRSFLKQTSFVYSTIKRCKKIIGKQEITLYKVNNSVHQIGQDSVISVGPWIIISSLPVNVYMFSKNLMSGLFLPSCSIVFQRYPFSCFHWLSLFLIYFIWHLSVRSVFLKFSVTSELPYYFLFLLFSL